MPFHQLSAMFQCIGQVLVKRKNTETCPITSEWQITCAFTLFEFFKILNHILLVGRSVNEAMYLKISSSSYKKLKL